MVKGTEPEKWNLRMVVFIKDNGYKEIETEEESFMIQQQNLITMDNGKTIKNKDMEP